MPAALTCPHCNVTLKPKRPPTEGARVKCPKCQTAFVVPNDGAREEEVLDEQVEGVAEAGDDEEAGETDAPKGRTRPKKKKKKKAPLWVWIAAGVGGLFLVCGCGGVSLVAYKMQGGGLFGSTVTVNNFKKLKRGMTEDDVQRILGTPSRSVMLAGQELNVVWDGRNRDYITVIFGPDGKSKQAHCHITQGGEVTTTYIDLP